MTVTLAWPRRSLTTLALSRSRILGQRAVSELVQGHAAGRCLEQILGLPETAGARDG